ncbi:ankyrin repeat domain-containing 52 [Fusarium longipes]|uniref:Ankyrin repeat domain-containing 52 n=1 Tax=Fusarium longipes TaxID=694270 RepID=A0A395SYY5_9HYPO|nr:ankyrin repeat domain-containing 52 [Fusarium longipes]
MEAVGLVIGVAGLFSTCLDAVDKAHSYCSFAADSHTLRTRFQTAKILLEQWGCSVGFVKGVLSANHSAELDKPDTEAAVRDILKIIKTICDPRTQRFSAHGPTEPSSGSKMKKLKWALGDKKKQEEQVELFEILVEQLRHLVPVDIDPEVTKSHTSIAEIHAILTRIERETRAEIRKQVLSWVGHGRTDQRYRDSLQKRLSGTCDWIHSRPVFQQWLTPTFENGFQALWVNGPAGFGKTVLCASIVDYLATTLQTPTAHFFLTSESHSRDDPFMAVRIWIAQITSQHEGAFDCTLVIDGLDECTHLDNHNASASVFLDAITTALSTSSSRILLISRDEPHIRNATADYFAEYTILADDVRADTASVSMDIINRKLSKKPDDFRISLSQTMATRCEGQFLWLRLQEESLRNGMNMKRLKNVVEGTPPGLGALYEREWGRILKSPDYDRIISLLQWAAFAIRPLTVGEITEAVLIGNYADFPMDDLPDEIDDDYVETEIMGLCAPLIQMYRRQEDGTDSSVDLRTVHLAHFSVKQFLLLHLPAPFALKTNESLMFQYRNTLLATACLQYMNFNEVWKNGIDDQRTMGSAFRNYAAGSWHHHVHDGTINDNTLLKLVTALFNEKNRVWNFWKSWLQKQTDDSFTAETTNGWKWWKSSESGPIYYAICLRLDSVAYQLIDDDGSKFVNTLDLARAAILVTTQVGRQEMLERLLKSGVDARMTATDGFSLLHYAAGYNSPQVAQLLIDNGVDVSATDDEGFTPLHRASKLEMARTLLNNGAIVDAKGRNGNTALHSAATSGSTDIVDLLLDRGATVDAPNESGFTALHLACFEHAEVAKRLIDQGASLKTSCTGSAPLHVACMMGRNDIVELLIRKGACIDDMWTDGTRAIHWAAKTGQYDTVKLLLESGASIEDRDNRGNRPLHLACHKEHTKVIELLINSGAEIECPDSNELTPLAISCYYGNLEAMDLLMAAGSSISSIISSHGETLLNNALARDHTQIISLLMDKGVSLTTPDKDGFQALIYAAAYGHSKLIELFVQRGASTSVTDKHGLTPLHHACRYGHIDIVKILLDSGSDLMSLDSNGLTCLHHASGGKSVELVKFLVDQRLVAGDKSTDGSTTLHYAASHGSVEVVDFLITQGVATGQARNDGLTAIDFAAFRGHADIFKLLVKAGQSDQTDSLGRTNLMLASRFGFDDAVQTLLNDSRVDPNIKDWHGSTALFAAVRNGHLGATEILLKSPKVMTGETDGFGRDIWWWANKLGNPEVLSLLQKYVGRKTPSIPHNANNHDPDMDVNVTAFDSSLPYCDACLISTDDHQSCPLCSDQSFCLCPACFQMVQIQCIGGVHSKATTGNLTGQLVLR